MNAWWRYDQLESGYPYDWSPASPGERRYDNLDFHLDIGCGRLKKARLGIDRHPDPGVDLVMDLETMAVDPEGTRGEEGDLWYPTMKKDGEIFGPVPGRLPFPDASINSIITHHCLEHLTAAALMHLMDECHRVLVKDGIMRIIVPLFPSSAAVEDPDHKRYFMVNSFEAFCGAPDGSHWHESFSTPYTKARFLMVDHDYTAPVASHLQWSEEDVRELRVALQKQT